MNVDSDNNSSDVDTTTSNGASKVQRTTIDITPERDKGVLKEIQRQGAGDEHPLKGDTVYLHYIGRLLDGTEFDSSRKGSEKFQFVLDSEDGTWNFCCTCCQRKRLAFSVFFCSEIVCLIWHQFHFRFQNTIIMVS